MSVGAFDFFLWASPHSISIRRKMCAKFNRIFCATLGAATTIALPVRGRVYVFECVCECVILYYLL